MVSKLETENKALFRKLEDMQKAKSIAKIKSQKEIKVKKQTSDLDYSVSFDLDKWSQVASMIC